MSAFLTHPEKEHILIRSICFLDVYIFLSNSNRHFPTLLLLFLLEYSRWVSSLPKTLVHSANRAGSTLVPFIRNELTIYPFTPLKFNLEPKYRWFGWMFLLFLKQSYFQVPAVSFLAAPFASQMVSVRIAFQQPEITKLMGVFLSPPPPLHCGIARVTPTKRYIKNGTYAFSIGNTFSNSGCFIAILSFPGYITLYKQNNAAIPPPPGDQLIVGFNSPTPIGENKKQLKHYHTLSASSIIK